MTKRRTIPTAPEPLEAYARHFDAMFGKSNQRDEFRHYLEGLLLPTERHKTLTGLVNTEPLVGAHLPRAQKLQWFLCESNWDEHQVQEERLKLLRDDPATTPTRHGVLVIDETGDRKDGHKTAHVSRQYLANLGKIDNGVVSVTSLWADERIYYPLEVEPYTPECYFAKGKNDPSFRTKLKIALQLVQRAVEQGWPFRAVVADNFYGEDRTLKRELRELNVPYVMALKPSHAWYHPQDVAGTLQDVAHEAGWLSADQPGQWVKMRRTFRNGSVQDWWAVEIIADPYGPDKKERAIVASTDPENLPDLSTWYLVTHLPAPTRHRESELLFAPASLEEIIRLYGLRMWVEQSYKQVKHALGWSQYQVRSDKAIRRHWQLVCCAFSFCWYHVSHSSCTTTPITLELVSSSAPLQQENSAREAGTRKKNQRGKPPTTLRLLAGGPADGSRVVGAMDYAAALLAWLVSTAPTSSITTPAASA